MSHTPSRFAPQSNNQSRSHHATPSTSTYKPTTSSLNPASSSSSSHARPPPKPLGTTLAPVLPLTPICPPRYQAAYSSYPARMRLGTSSLMQPNALAASGRGEGGSSSVAGPGKRARTVNYSDLAGEGDFGEDDDGRARGSGGSREREVWGDGRSYLGVLPPGSLVRVQEAKPTRHTPCTEDQLEDQADELAVFVPVQIDIDVDTFKIRDAFVWNVNEKLITPEAFARVFCDDLDIPQIWATEVAKQIAEQIEEQIGVAEIPLRPPQDEADFVERDLRCILNLDVQIGTLHLVDQIEWDLSSPLTPELFASILVRDLGLSSSAGPLIAHALHAELHRHKKNCLELGLLLGGPDEAKAQRGARQLQGVWREWADVPGFGPRLEVLSLDEMDKMEADRERAIRRAKRDRLQARPGGRRR